MIALLLMMLLLPTTVDAAGMWGSSKDYVISSGCSTPQSGNDLNEGFVGIANSGYELTGWGVTLGTNGTINPNYVLTGTPPVKACEEGLLTSIGLNSTATYVSKSLPTTITSSTVVDIEIAMNLTSFTLAEYDYFTIFAMQENVFDRANYLRFQYEGGNLRIRCLGATVTPYTTFPVGSWVDIHIHIDGVNSYLVINGGAQQNFEAHATRISQVVYLGGLKDVDSVEEYSVEWGGIWINLP